MSIQEIRDRLQAIKDIAQDDECAHGLEDALYKDFIEYVSEYANSELREKANLILTSENISFGRWMS